MPVELTVTSTDNLAVPWTDVVTKEIFTKIGSGLVSQVSLEVLGPFISRGLVSQIALEVLGPFTSRGLISQVALEVLLAKAIPTEITDSIIFSDTIETFLDILGGNVIIADDLANLIDDIQCLLDYTIEVDDTNNNWDDAIGIISPEFETISENLNSGYYDEVVTQVWTSYFAYSVIWGDSFSFDDSLDSIALIFEGSEIAFDLGDSNRLSESIEIVEYLLLSLEDTLDSWNDGVALMPGDFVELSYDTMMYDFLDAIEVDFRELRENSDSFILSDAVSTSLDAFLQFTSVGDSLTNWLDSVSMGFKVNRSIGDDLNLYDFIQLFLTTTRGVSDAFIFTDSILVSLSSQEVSSTESLQLWQDLVSAELQTKFSLNLSDSMSLSDAVTTPIPEEDLMYYRRYLNDVIR